MSEALEIYDGEVGAPNDPDANATFHQEIIDRLAAFAAREYGWRGARFCSYSRERGVVCIGISPGAAWPTLDDLRTAMPEIRLRREPDPVEGGVDDDGQRRMSE